ncbi:unnamed protein product [Parnassius apollo]|uniref:(apollo) hypothetical protein n=1 Tax=Parnassius apollo TaxID=110799 RepID=A0A8S3XSG1_PARAO|nr:unnamed protein product [Parnassius apollo]
MISDVDTSLRGFSFMPEIKTKEMDLQYVEDRELEQAWRSRRRERVRQQEQKIWEEFIQEQDIVQSVYKSDPYQFIENIPETCLQELLEKEINKMQKKKVEEEVKEEDAVEIATTPPDTPSIVVQNDKTYNERQDMQEVLHIFYDDKDNEELSGNEGEVLNESGGSPLCTVRENQVEKEQPKAQEPSPSPEKVPVSGKSSGNVATMVENSIYCAKVKELRARINEELLSIIATVEHQNLINMDPEDLKKIQKRSSEFSSRFSRIHLYQLQRQIQDLKRHNSAASLPFGQHTQLQAQMVRTVSLYQNLWQAFCALHKWFRQSLCTGAVVTLCRCAARLPRDLPAFPATPDPCNDDLLKTCDRFEETVAKHGERADELIKSLEDANNPYAKKPSKNMAKKNPSSAYLKAGPKSTSRADGKLSMYSLDTLRINLKAKSSTTRENLSSGTSKLCGTASKALEKRAPDRNKTPKHRRKSPTTARARTRRAEADVRTLVEAVTCTSSHVSFEASSQRSPNANNLTYRSKGASQSGKSKETTPRSKHQETSRKIQKVPNVPKNSICDENSTVKSCSEFRNEEINVGITKKNFMESPRAHLSLGQDGAQSRRSGKENMKVSDSLELLSFM